MKKTFSFGKIDFFNRGVRDNAVSVEVEYNEKDGKKVFTACGNIWNRTHTDIVAGGQCLDTIAEYVKDEKFLEIYRLWKLYHLNDMHPECEHQAEMGWAKKACENVNIYNFTMTTEAIKERNALKEKIMQAAKEGRAYLTSQDEQIILCLSYSVKSHIETLPENIKKFYKLEKTDKKMLGWLYEKDHPDGLLSKPCPICGYKYGTAWKYVSIPEQDEKVIYDLLRG